MSNTLPTIAHAQTSFNEWGRVVIQMDDGWVFYNLNSYPEGTPAEDICYSRYGVYPADYDFTKIIVVDETTINSDQIYGVSDKPVTE